MCRNQISIFGFGFFSKLYFGPGHHQPRYATLDKKLYIQCRNNESRIETLKKFLSAVNSFTDRAGTDPSFMMFNLPITLLALMGKIFYLSIYSTFPNFDRFYRSFSKKEDDVTIWGKKKDRAGTDPAFIMFSLHN